MRPRAAPPTEMGSLRGVAPRFSRNARRVNADPRARRRRADAQAL